MTTLSAPDFTRRRGHRSLIATALTTALTLGATIGWSTATAEAATGTEAIADSDWRGIVNAYRNASGLDPVTENATWSSEARAHSCYMLQNGITHDEIPGRPGYTAGGDTAGNNGNVAVSTSGAATARDHIDLWMTGPFHAIGILRPALASSGFGICAEGSTPTPWHSGATLDVLRGLDPTRSAPTSPIVFPGDGATVALDRFVAESPNPVELCGWSGTAGLPLIAIFPGGTGNVGATLDGPAGRLDVCVLHGGNVADPLARSILERDNAVVVVPRNILAEGTYRARVTTSAGTASWSFGVDLDAELTRPDPTPDTSPSGPLSTFDSVAPLRLVDTRLGQGATTLIAGTTTRIKVADASVGAVSANFVAVRPEANGYLTAFDCTPRRPTVSTINYRAGSVVANQAIVPLADGDLCVFSRATTDVVIDVNGYYRAGSGGDGFQPVSPTRLFDSRKSVSLRSRQPVRIPVTGAPSHATAVALNLTAIHASERGWLRVSPCESDATVASLNYVAGEVRANSAIVAIGAGGTVCVTSLRDIDVTIDMTGYFSGTGGLDFEPLSPIRLFDSRSTDRELNPATSGTQLRSGQIARLDVAGNRGIPSDAEAVTLNIAATDPSRSTFVTVFDCGTRPSTANLNLSTSQQTIANGAIVRLSSGGDLCVYARADVHVIVDINGVFR